jgi:cytochrome c553
LQDCSCQQEFLKKKTNVKILTALALSVLLMTPAIAADVNAGKAKYATCMGCHGAKGQGGMGPALAGQTTAAIEMKLKKYRNKEKIGSQSALMWGMSAGLSDADISNLAAYTASLK